MKDVTHDSVRHRTGTPSVEPVRDQTKAPDAKVIALGVPLPPRRGARAAGIREPERFRTRGG